MSWNRRSLPDQTGRHVLLTGGNSDLAIQTAKELAQKGATVHLTVRDEAKGDAAEAEIKAHVPGAEVQIWVLDLLDFASIRRFCSDFTAKNQRLDLVYANAGVVLQPTRKETAAGQELQMHANHLGHFALVTGLFDMISSTPGARVISLNTMRQMHDKADLDFDDFTWSRRPYDPMASYVTSRIAQLLFSFKLNQFFKDQNSSAIALGMQPGLVATRGQTGTAGGGILDRQRAPVVKGCSTHLRAGTDPSVTANTFLQPRFGVRGAPKIYPFKPIATDPVAAEKLWKISAEISGSQTP